MLTCAIVYGQNCEENQKKGREFALSDHKEFGYIYCQNSENDFFMAPEMYRVFLDLVRQDNILIQSQSCLTNSCEWQGYKAVSDSIYYSKFTKRHLKNRVKEARVIWQNEVLENNFTLAPNCKQRIAFQVNKKLGGHLINRYLRENKPANAKYKFTSAYDFCSLINWKSYVNEEGIVDSLKFGRCFYRHDETPEQINEVQSYIISMFIGKKLYNPCKFCGEIIRTVVDGNTGVDWIE